MSFKASLTSSLRVRWFSRLLIIGQSFGVGTTAEMPVSLAGAVYSLGASALADPEEAFGFACRHLLFPGGLGLLIACVLAATMASCSALMVDSGALLTQGF